MSIKSKIRLIALIAIVGFSIYFGYSVIDSRQNQELLNEVATVDFRIQQILGRNNTAILQLEDMFELAISEGDEATLEEARAGAVEFVERLKELESLDSKTGGEINELIKAFEAYYVLADELAEKIITTYEIDHNGVIQLTENLSTYRDLQKQFYDNKISALSERLEQSKEDNRNKAILSSVMGLILLIGIATMAYYFAREITQAIEAAVEAAKRIGSGNWDVNIESKSDDEAGQLLSTMEKMRVTLRDNRDAEAERTLFQERKAKLNEVMRGDFSDTELGEKILSYLVPCLEAQIGAFFRYNPDSNMLKLMSSHAYARRKEFVNEFSLGESLVGQAALEKKAIIIENAPSDYLSIGSGTGKANVSSVAVMPIMHDEQLLGVIEVGSFSPFAERDLQFLEDSMGAIGVVLNLSESRHQLANTLSELQLQADELEGQKTQLASANSDLENQAMELVESERKLQIQQEELRATNEELEEQTQALRASEESLQAQQEELRVTNEELEAQAKALETQKTEIEEKNQVLQDKTRELELSSKYKSEFLSTMSHELRTPLNSILILSNSLANNKKGNLDDKQIEHAQVIHSAGSDLLSLINDILDLSKVEEGKMDVVIDNIELADMRAHIDRTFKHMAETRGLGFEVTLEDGLPSHAFSDRHRVEQILRNLLSNALKFTETGSVKMHIQRVPESTSLELSGLAHADAFQVAVVDTGIGIPEEKQRMIFEAFQQADGTTSRKYGGTGLGLTISRELSRMLGGELQVSSEGEGKGSQFTLILPFGDESMVDVDEANIPHADARPMLQSQAASSAPAPQPSAANGAAQQGEVVVADKTILIIEDDSEFAGVLSTLADDYGFKSVTENSGEDGLEYAKKYRPSAIILDVGLPGIDGWEVMKQLKADARTENIPVHFLSGQDQESSQARELGAIDYLTKPVSEGDLSSAFQKIEVAISKNLRRLLIVEDNEIQMQLMQDLFADSALEFKSVTTGQEAIEALKDDVYDCMILDLSLPDMTGFDLLEQMNTQDDIADTPVIIYTARDLTRDDEARLRKYADRIILKTDRSPERLLNEASLFLHWLEGANPSSDAPEQPADEGVEGDHRDGFFGEKSVLLVDDDMRNIYALSATLEEWGCDVSIANNGLEALAQLDENGAYDIVLMDIMMPEMDGYEAMTKIREQEQFEKLPMLALTAKAMKDDRQKCIDAGANDYISKPIDTGRLQSLMRVWMAS